MPAASTTPATDRGRQRRLPDFEGADGAEEDATLTPDVCVCIAEADSLTEAGRAIPELEEAAANGAAATGTAESETAATVPELADTDVPEMACPDSVSRFSRCKS